MTTFAALYAEWDALTEPERQALRDAQDDPASPYRKLTLGPLIAELRPDVWARVIASSAAGVAARVREAAS